MPFFPTWCWGWPRDRARSACSSAPEYWSGIPSLNFTVVESGAGWLAWVLCALDEQAGKKHMWVRPQLEMSPSEYFKRQGHVTFSDDLPALRMLDITGDETLLWGSDYPHDEGTFPHSHEVAERIFEGVPEDATRKILYENAASSLRFSR